MNALRRICGASAGLTSHTQLLSIAPQVYNSLGNPVLDA